MRSSVKEVPSTQSVKRAGVNMMFHMDKMQKFMGEGMKNQTDLMQRIRDRASAEDMRYSRSDGRTETLERRLSELSEEVKQLRAQNKVMEKNIKLLMEERAQKKKFHERVRHSHLVVTTSMPSQPARPQQPGMDFMSQPTQYWDYGVYER
ncbi:hypothetical protein AAP_06092 [Ascosphaera apis ARSEF 7405]|uniref:Uncharacterized protein n=1 Tax=Ascosphaera apis ARSEF 7405 TaxID=392613 RepID=A0A162IC63_9EURO|nr:hypothetical protein AAP_06092 [Ascosphaera apis ARSEF 7405]